MPGMSYVSSYFRCVFSTKERRPLIMPALRQRLWPFLGGIARPGPTGQTVDESQKLARLRLRPFLDSHSRENLTHLQHVLKFKRLESSRVSQN